MCVQCHGLIHIKSKNHKIYTIVPYNNNTACNMYEKRTMHGHDQIPFLQVTLLLLLLLLLEVKHFLLRYITQNVFNFVLLYIF